MQRRSLGGQRERRASLTITLFMLTVNPLEVARNWKSTVPESQMFLLTDISLRYDTMRSVIKLCAHRCKLCRSCLGGLTACVYVKTS